MHFLGKALAMTFAFGSSITFLSCRTLPSGEPQSFAGIMCMSLHQLVLCVCACVCVYKYGSERASAGTVLVCAHKFITTFGNSFK